MWSYLAPFFATRGYQLYVHDPRSRHGAEDIAPPLPPLRGAKGNTWPWARYYLDSDDEAVFDGIQTLRVWAAQKRDRREVVIRLAATADDPLSAELQVYQRLNSPLARSDPRIKRTLPTLDFIDYEGMTFVVMPRCAPRMIRGDNDAGDYIVAGGQP